MTHEEKINYMRIAAGICRFGINTKELDLLVCLYELVLEKKGKANLEDACKIENEVKERDDAKRRSELLDKVSTKV